MAQDKIALGVDPGKHIVGYGRARLVNGRAVLIECGMREVRSLTQISMFLSGLAFDEMVVEKPRVYPGRKGKGDPNDLIDVATVAGACLAAYLMSEAVEPATWKGGVPKNVHHARFKASLADDKQSLIALEEGLYRVPESLQHNVIDGAALAVWRARRMGQ